MFREYLCFILFIICFEVSICNRKDYGTTNILITKFETCKGPKRLDCIDGIFKLSSPNSLAYKLNLKENIVIINGKTVGTSNGKELIKYQTKKPCDSLLIKSLLQLYVNISENCMVSKGMYDFTVDIESISQKYYNGMYVYGNWTFKSVFYANNCNFLCTVIELNITPKAKKS